MNEQVARRVVLVRAIESADTGHQVLSEDDRKYASRSARELAAWQAADSKARSPRNISCEQRSEQIIKRLAERTPAFAASSAAASACPASGRRCRS
jgi:predicted kinase